MRGLMRAEGVDFATTLFDTNNLSTIRGASLALGRLGDGVAKGLAAAGAANVKKEFAGASQCLFSFDLAAGSIDDAAAVVRATLSKSGEVPFSHLSIMVDAVELGSAIAPDTTSGERVLTARNRARQMRGFSVPPLAFTMERRKPDRFEGIQPGSVKTPLPKGRILDHNDDDGEAEMLAPSVAARRAYGRRMRTKFYEHEIGDRARGIRVTNSLADMVEDHPPGLPPSLSSKIAVVYADGNGFGTLRERKDVGSRAFSTALATYHRNLLGQVVDWLMTNSDDRAFAVRDERGRRAIRFETLVYGGDELTVVMPAWLVASFVEGFFAATAKWAIGGTRLTHAMGVAIANAKTPIRQLTAIAMEAADAAKDAGLREKDSVTFEIFESLSPPDTNISGLRQDLYGKIDDAALARLLAVPGEAFGALRRSIARLKGDDGGDGFPRSQIYAALRAARTSGQSLCAGDNDAQAALDAYASRAGADLSLGASALKLPSVGGRGIALDLALVAAFWDYADPLAGGPSSELTDFVA